MQRIRQLPLVDAAAGLFRQMDQRLGLADVLKSQLGQGGQQRPPVGPVNIMEQHGFLCGHVGGHGGGKHGEDTSLFKNNLRAYNSLAYNMPAYYFTASDR